jgi:hypothetical protein
MVALMVIGLARRVVRERGRLRSATALLSWLAP